MKNVSRLWLAIGVLGLLAAWWWNARAPDERDLAAQPTTVEEASTPRPETALVDSEHEAERTAVGEPASAAATEVGAAELAQAAQATLRVRVVAKETGAPLASMHVSVRPHDPPEGWSASWEDRATGTEREVLTSGEDGRVEFDLRAGVEFTVSAEGWNPGASNATAGSTSDDVAPLAPGEVRELELAAPTSIDLVFFGRVVAEEDDSPLAGARIRLRKTLPGEPPVRVSDADGRFELRSATWFNARDFTVKLAGRAERSACVVEGHATLEKAFTIHLARHASVSFRARDPLGGSVAGLRVSATTKPWELRESQDFMAGVSFGSFGDPDPTWSVALDENGTGRLDELPPNAGLTIEVVRDERIVLQVTEPLRLAPGETRELELVVGSGAKLDGTVRDQDGKPVGGARLWLAPAEGEFPSLFEWYEKPQHETTTNDVGHYTFDAVAAGKWWLGPEPSRGRGQPLDELAFAPVTSTVEIAADATTVNHDLIVYRGLYIAGTVLDEHGQSAPGAGVELSDTRGIALFETSDALGAFVVGPLPAGAFELVAGGFSDRVHASGEPVRVRAGDRDVVLRVRAGATIVGRVVDPTTHQPTPAELSYRRRANDGEFVGATLTGVEGEFELAGLDPGHYYLAAHRGDQCAVAEIEALGGSTTSPVTLELAPAATIEVEWKGSTDFAEVTVRLGPNEVGFAYLGKGLPESIKVLPGELTVEYVPTSFSTDAETPIRADARATSLRLAAGESTKLELTDAP
ncbi:MAG: hypothetical protein L6Q99_09320 [Planctomycetes bacterium]|nr:hypothetical protein [Planctomycetota bacterium]